MDELDYSEIKKELLEEYTEHIDEHGNTKEQAIAASVEDNVLWMKKDKNYKRIYSSPKYIQRRK